MYLHFTRLACSCESAFVKSRVKPLGGSHEQSLIRHKFDKIHYEDRTISDEQEILSSRMSQRNISSFFVRTPRQDGRGSQPQASASQPQAAPTRSRPGATRSAQPSESPQPSWQPMQHNQVPKADQTPLSGQKRDARGMPASRSGNLGSKPSANTPQQMMVPPRPPQSSHKPADMHRRRRELQAKLGDDTKDAAKAK